jgi:hypothetical protein
MRKPVLARTRLGLSLCALLLGAARVVHAEASFAAIAEQTEFAVQKAAADEKPDYTCSKTKPCKLGCCKM